MARYEFQTKDGFSVFINNIDGSIIHDGLVCSFLLRKIRLIKCESSNCEPFGQLCINSQLDDTNSALSVSIIDLNEISRITGIEIKTINTEAN